MAEKVKTLAVDIGGTGIKAALLDENGQMIGKRVRLTETGRRYATQQPRLRTLMLGPDAASGAPEIMWREAYERGTRRNLLRSLSLDAFAAALERN